MERLKRGLSGMTFEKGENFDSSFEYAGGDGEIIVKEEGLYCFTIVGSMHAVTSNVVWRNCLCGDKW